MYICWLICKCGTLTRADYSKSCPTCGCRKLEPATQADLDAVRSTGLPGVVAVHKTKSKK